MNEKINQQKENIVTIRSDSPTLKTIYGNNLFLAYNSLNNLILITTYHHHPVPNDDDSEQSQNILTIESSREANILLPLYLAQKLASWVGKISSTSDIGDDDDSLDKMSEKTDRSEKTVVIKNSNSPTLQTIFGNKFDAVYEAGPDNVVITIYHERPIPNDDDSEKSLNLSIIEKNRELVAVLPLTCARDLANWIENIITNSNTSIADDTSIEGLNGTK